MKNTQFLAPLIHPARKSQPRLTAKVTPQTFVAPDEFEQWVASQNGTLASILEIPEKWEIPFAQHPRGYVALTSTLHPQLAQSIGTEVKGISFDKPLEAGQPVLMWVNPTAVAA
jgi:hypothetical protein